jgi:hypothetical protein
LRCGGWGSAIKKTLRHPKADAAARILLQAKIKLYEAQGRPIVYIDESGFAHDMPRTHGYSLIAVNIDADIFNAWIVQDLIPKLATPSAS